MIPHVGGYWADPMLADFDNLLFGQDPWHLFRSDDLGPLFAKIYISWFPITFGTMGLLAFSKRDHSAAADLLPGDPDHRRHHRPICAPFGRTDFLRAHGTRPALCGADRDQRSDLHAVSPTICGGTIEAGGANLGTGISAMPSLHVTLAVWTRVRRSCACGARSSFPPPATR